MNKNTLRQIINVLAVLLTLAVNGLANALPLNGHTTGEISDNLKVIRARKVHLFLFYVIYLFLFGFAIYQALPFKKENPRLCASCRNATT